MVNSINRKQNFLNRGGILCLLSFLLASSGVLAQRLICTANSEVQSEKYGQITIAGLGEKSALFKATSLSFEDWTSFFSVRVEGATRPVLGSYEATGTSLVFTPRFLPDPQINYEVKFSSRAARELLSDFSLNEELKQVVKFARSRDLTAEVVDVFPMAELLPANILRLYVEFSEPMSFGNPHEFIQIQDEDGDEILQPFVEIEEGLWNADRTRLTLLFHQGRIKRGVGPNMTMGEIFVPNMRYTLTIREDWSAGSGNGLKNPFSKTFKISDPVRETINFESWKINSPQFESQQRLTIETSRILDKALAERMISVLDLTGNSLDGRWSYNDKTKTLSFVPVADWKAGKYQVSINPKLEDVCGNTPLNVFDLEGSGQKKGGDNLHLNFEVDRD